jgi:4-amino-4-deoxy-L-arabinose transferase-like glycosyltransferase
VTIPADIAASKNTRALAERIGWTALICATLYVCYFSHLGAIGFVGPDEPRYAWIARDMAETGDWITPRLYGQPWFEKPPLYYWGAAICFKLFGVSEAVARLPSAISALLATLAMAWLAWRIYGAETARWLVLLLPTTVGMIGFSHAAATDMPFSAMLTIAMVYAAVLLRLPLECGGPPRLSRDEAVATKLPEPPPAPSAVDSQSVTPSFAKTSWPAAIPFGFFLGLAVLAKGPVAIILCGGAIFFWALFTKWWRATLRLLHPAAIVAFCVTALPWYILCARRNPDFFRIFIIEHNFKRYLTPEFQHIQPFWFYGPVLLVAFLPWTVGLLGGSSNPGSRPALNSYILCFGLFPILFFTVSRSKLPGYILPTLPALALLLAVAVEKRWKIKTLTAAFAITSIGLGLALYRFAAHRALGSDILPAPWFSQVSACLVFTGILAGIFVFLRRPVVSICAIQVGVLLATWSFSSGLVWVDPQFSARGVIAAGGVGINSLASEDVFVNDVPRGINYGLNFYLRREIPQWRTGMRGIVFTTSKRQSELQAAGYTCQAHLVLPAAILCSVTEPLPAYAPGGGKAQ